MSNRLLYEEDIINAVDRHTNDDGTLDDDISCILEEVKSPRFTEGDIVYWCHNDGGGHYSVKYGMVDKHFSDRVIIDLLAPKERRMVNGIKIDQFESETRYRKLPSSWGHKTPLYNVTYEDLTPDEIAFSLDIKDSKSIKKAYENGYLVKDSTIFHGTIESDITKDGYRIVKKYPMWMHHIDHVSIEPYKVYFTYEEAEKEVNDNNNEFLRQAALSDYDWSVEQIDKTLGMYQKMTDCSDGEVKQYRDWLLNMKNVEDIETRLYGYNIQWKYWKNKKWNYIEL